MTWKQINKEKVIDIIKKDLPEEVTNKLLADKELLINTDETAKLVSVTKEVLEVFKKLTKKIIQPMFIGSPVLDTKDLIKYRLSLPFVYKASTMNVPKAIIRHKGEQLFLYGRDVWSGTVKTVQGTIKRKGLVFLFNESNIFLGIAFARNEDLMIHGHNTVLKNVIDTGHYLRCEKTIKKNQK